jgi:hypothetical protein
MIFGDREDKDAEVKTKYGAEVTNMRALYPDMYPQAKELARDYPMLRKDMLTKAAYTGHTTTAAQGGETIPTPLAARIIDLIDKATFTRQIFRIFFMPGATYEIPTKTALESTFRVAEGVDLTLDVPTIGTGSAITRGTYSSITLAADKLMTLGGYNSELGEDSNINWARQTLEGMARSHSEAVEKAILQGQLAGVGTTSNMGYNAGNPNYIFDGLIWHIEGTNASTGGVFTPDVATLTMWKDGQSNALTDDELQFCMSEIEEAGFRCRYYAMRPKVHARMRDDTEFANFQTVSAIGSKSALIKGHVGDYYNAKIISSLFMPSGAYTGVHTTGEGKYGSGATDTMVIGFDNREPIIGDRRRLEVRRRHRFYQDINEIRLRSRIAFDVERPSGSIAGVNDVKLSI